jgi:hypothetical protein
MNKDHPSTIQQALIRAHVRRVLRKLAARRDIQGKEARSVRKGVRSDRKQDDA